MVPHISESMGGSAEAEVIGNVMASYGRGDQGRVEHGRVGCGASPCS
jgi:hypothetical protein